MANPVTHRIGDRFDVVDAGEKCPRKATAIYRIFDKRQSRFLSSGYTVLDDAIAIAQAKDAGWKAEKDAIAARDEILKRHREERAAKALQKRRGP